jgi:cardiolipin synthase
MYRVGLRSAKQRVIIANAYFFPSYRLLRDLARTARRGVDVKLIVQGRPDIPVSAMATTMLYGYLRGSGVKIFRYNDRALHAKVAVIDGVWSTVGSSNLDPISLGLNLEANLVMLDRQFAAILERSLESLLERSCEEVSVAIPKRSIINRLVLAIVYLLTRRMSFWGKFVRGDAEAVNQTRPAELETERVGAD